MDALHPRLLTARFAETFAFYRAVLPPLLGAELVRGGPEGPYAHWDVAGQGLLSLFDRAAWEASPGVPAVAAPGDAAVFVCRVADVDAGLALCLEHGASEAAPAADRPAWGPGLRTAHLRDPEGRLIELQSY